jgi:hypothetical protein
MMSEHIQDRQQLARVGLTRIRIVFWTVGILIALYQCVLYSQWINGDAISYLDMGDGVGSGDFGRLVNATWSPLYAVLLGIASAIVRPSAAREFALAHAVNFVCFLLAFIAFEFLMASASSLRPRNGNTGDFDGHPALPIVGYSFFLWASLGMLTLMKLTPDMLMMALLFVAAGLLLRIRNGVVGWQTYALLGVALGLGYLAKAIMFPLGVLMLGMTLFFGGKFRTRVQRTLIAAVFFAVVAGPFVVAVSRQAHRATIGEAGTIVHMNYVERISPYFQSTGGGTGSFVHPVTMLVRDYPPVVSFTRPIHVTYALWFDPYYFSEGVRPVLNVRRQAALVAGNLRVYVGLLGELTGVVLVILYMALRVGPRLALRSILDVWPWWVVSLAALAAYAVFHVETRYVGAFALLLGMGSIFALWHRSKFSGRTLTLLSVVVVLNLGIDTVAHMYLDREEQGGKRRLHSASAAVALHQFGIAAGEPVGAIESLVGSGWARLARVEIVAEVPRSNAQDYWRSSPEHQTATLAAFASAGCKAVVSWIGRNDVPAGWQRLGDSQYVVHRLP